MNNIRDLNFFRTTQGKLLKEEQEKLEKRIYSILETYDYSESPEQLNRDVEMLIGIFQKKVIKILQNGGDN